MTLGFFQRRLSNQKDTAIRGGQIAHTVADNGEMRISHTKYWYLLDLALILSIRSTL